MSTVLVWKANQRSERPDDGAVERERREAYFQRITVAHRELSIDNLAAALRALAECPEDLRGWEWHYLMRLCKVEPLVIRDTTEVNGVAFSPTASDSPPRAGTGPSRSGTAGRVELVQTFPAHADSVVSVAFHPDGQHLASAGADRQVKVWDLSDRPAGVHRTVRRHSQVRGGIYRGVQSPTADTSRREATGR